MILFGKPNYILSLVSFLISNSRYLGNLYRQNTFPNFELDFMNESFFLMPIFVAQNYKSSIRKHTF